MPAFSHHSGHKVSWNPFVTLLCLSLFTPFLAAQQPQLVPQPREFRSTSQVFEVKPNTEIVLSPATAVEDRTAGESLQDELKLASGVEFPIVSAPSSERVPAIRLARFGDSHVNAALQAAGLNAGGIGDQCYGCGTGPRSRTGALRWICLADGSQVELPQANRAHHC